MSVKPHNAWYYKSFLQDSTFWSLAPQSLSCSPQPLLRRQVPPAVAPVITSIR
jgi:hypothetical protein